jgi:hypothetical protein
LALDFENMNLFRDRALSKTLEDTQSWDYRLPKNQRNVRETRKSVVDVSSGVGGGKSKQRRGTINLIKNLMKHKVNIINEYEERDEYSEDDDDDSENTRLRNQLRNKLRKDVQGGNGGNGGKGGKKQIKVNAAADVDGAGSGDDGNGSGSDGGGNDDWNNLKTGGPI